MKLKINFLSQLKMLLDLIFISLIFLFIIFVCDDWRLASFLLLPYFLVYFFPVLFLHFNYLNINKRTVFDINRNVIYVKNEERTNEYKKDCIGGIVFYINGARETKVGILAHKEYYYAKIELLDGSSFVITSLCSSKIDKILQDNFPNVKTTTEKEFYPMIS